MEQVGLQFQELYQQHKAKQEVLEHKPQLYLVVVVAQKAMNMMVHLGQIVEILILQDKVKNLEVGEFKLLQL